MNFNVGETYITTGGLWVHSYQQRRFVVVKKNAYGISVVFEGDDPSVDICVYDQSDLMGECRLDETQNVKNILNHYDEM